MFDLKNKTVLITGASGGIGHELAAAFAAAGATVAVSGRSKEKLDELIKSNAALAGAIPITADLSIGGAAAELVEKTIKSAGKVDILINNAGITKDTLLMRMTDGQFDEVINVNLRSVFQMCRAAIAPMMKQRFGRIINMASIVGCIGGPGQANYAASKGGIIALTKSIAAEVGARGITANAIAPGFIKSPMTDVLPDELKDAYLKQIPAGRFGAASDVAAAAIFLASDEASYVNGQTLHVNGGMARF